MLVKEFKFSSSALGKRLADLAVNLVPLREFLLGNLLKILTFVHSVAKARSLDSITADTESPAHESTNLVGVELAIDQGGDAGVDLIQILLKEMFGLFLGDNETLEDVRASVTVTNGPVTLGILLGLETQTLQVLDELQGLMIVPFLL